MTAPAAPPPEFSQAATEQLRDALRSYLSSPELARRDALRLALECVCAEAHAAQLGPERILVTVKTIWAHIPGNERAEVERTRLLLERVVAYSIEAYYCIPDAGLSGFVEQRQQSRIV